MHFTFSHDTTRRPFWQNTLLKAYCVLLPAFLLYTGLATPDHETWVLENVLTASSVILLVAFYRHYRFSDLSYTFFFLFLMLHIYGSQYNYSENPFGEWLKEQYDLERNHYDRIVHFCFGVLLAYPMRELLLNVLKVRPLLGYLLPVEYVLVLSTVYELVEWVVADLFYPEKGAEYLGHQGDEWDAQKDIFLATVGAAAIMLGVWLLRRLKRKPQATAAQKNSNA